MIAVDTSVIIDFLFDGPSAEHSELALRDAAERGRLAISDVVLAEVCARGESTALRQALASLGFQFVPTNETAAARAGEMFERYRRRGGVRGRILAEFLIGAHALIQCEGLITFDAGFHRDYFKGLRLIVPGQA
ncbi:MAG: type II toxin-antitoxin system VapC family toxin [Casimicrobiaceae bacterium]|nr:type II toxin-antitoxin system VapC family toxin [Casimicrobiaceae bacterium]